MFCMCVLCRESSHEGLTAKGNKLFHRLHAGRHRGSFKCFSTRRLGQSPDLFAYLLNCVHNPPLVLEVSWRCWYYKGVVKDLCKNKPHPMPPGFSSALSWKETSFHFAGAWSQSHGSSAVPQCPEGTSPWFSVLSRHPVHQHHVHLFALPQPSPYWSVWLHLKPWYKKCHKSPENHSREILATAQYQLIPPDWEVLIVRGLPWWKVLPQDYTISTGMFQENGENTGRIFPVQEFAFHSAESFRCSSAYTPQTEKILHAPAHTHICSSPTEASLLQIYHIKIPLLLNSKKSMST